MDFSCSQQHLNNFEDVKENAEKCLAQYKSLGEEHELPYEYAKYFNHMAYVSLYEGDTAKTVKFAEKGYQLAERATPGAQLAVLYKFDWANIVFPHGDVEQSLSAHKEMLKVRKRECGEDNI